MRLMAVLLSSIAVLSCSGASRPPTRDAGDATALPVVHEDGGGAVLPVAMTPAGDAPLCMSVDLASIDGWMGTLAQRLPADIADLLDRELGGLVSELRGGAPLQVLGLDTSRPATVLVAPLDASLDPVVDELSALAATVGDGQALSPVDRTRYEALAERLGASGLWVRVSLPVEGAPRLLDLLRQLVGREARPAPPGFELVTGEDDGTAVAIWRDGTSLVLDAWMPFAQGASAFAQVVQLRSRPFTWPAWAPAPTSGTSTFAMRPAPIARLAFAHGVSMVRRALASADPSYGATIAAAGLRESRRAIQIADGSRGLSFERVVVRVHADEAAPGGELTAEVRPGGSIDPAASAVAPSLAAPGVAILADVAPAALARLPLPTTEGSSNPGRSFERAVEEAGAWGFVLAIPFAMPFAGNTLVEEVTERLPAGRFERVGILHARPDDGRATVFGILPAGTTAAQARCALAPAGVACGRLALRPGATVAAPDGFAKLLRVADRWVVLLGAERDRVDVPGLGLVAPGAPVRVAVDGAAFVRGVPDLAWAAPLVGRPWVLELLPSPSALRAELRSSAVTP